jgi:hypothetical protein
MELSRSALRHRPLQRRRRGVGDEVSSVGPECPPITRKSYRLTRTADGREVSLSELAAPSN